MLDAHAHWRLGNTHCEHRRWDAALASYARALERDPLLAEAHLNRGNVFQVQERWTEALEAYERTLALWPRDPTALSNRGIVLKELHRFAEALESFDLAIAIDPTKPTVRYNRGLLALQLGRFDEGWQGYEERWRDPLSSLRPHRRDFCKPRWNGRDPLDGKRILLYAEQGFGDTLQFCRYVPILAEAGAVVLLEVPAALIGLLADLDGVTQLIATGRPLPEFDYHCPLLSLPYALQTTLVTIPRRIPYLRAEPDKVNAWRARLDGSARPRVGLAWAGSPMHCNDRNRSMPLQMLLGALSDRPCYVSLQKDVPAVDLPTVSATMQLQSWTDELLDFSDTAALIEALDLVVAVDTSVAHLAGSLGKSCWVMLPFHPDWRWLLDRDDSPWYPSLVLFRQPRRRDWSEVLARVAAALAAYA